LAHLVAYKMSIYTNDTLKNQILTLSEKLWGPFPYQDCRVVMKQIAASLEPRESKRYGDLIPDLDAYFYLVSSHSRGVMEFAEWTATEMVASRELLKKSFFQTHRRYYDIQWMINEINSPVLFMRLTASNELRSMLLKLISDKVEESQRVNVARQEKFLLALESC
jgi:hypothetical protein